MAQPAAAGSLEFVSMRAGGGWHVFGNDEDARAALQDRLTVLSRVMFWSFAVLLVAMLLLYRGYPELKPHRQDAIYVISLIGIALLAVFWRGLLVRRKVSLRTLYAIDYFYAGSSGGIFASAAFLAFPDLATSGWVNLLWSCFVVFLRTIILPSTGRRTAIAGGFTFTPMIAATIGISIETKTELPAPAFIGGAIMIAALVILLATIGSRLIYGLRRQVSEAMRLGQYTLGEKIGAGGNGAVYRAHHALLRRPTAIKVILPDKVAAETIERFEREVQHMSLLTHPNSVAVYDYGHSPNGVFYYAMEYLDGINLEDLVIEHGLVPADRVIAILLQVCGSLGEAHRRGITHRDVKPANILLCERGDVPDVAKVVDFGLAKEIDQSTSDTTRTIIGTPAYISPEAVTDPSTVGPATDIYALGAVAYFLLTGRRVFNAQTTVEMCIQHVTAVPKPLSMMTTKSIPPALEALVLRCLAKAPADRPASTTELARLLREIPPAGDWDEARAVEWWASFRKMPKAASSAPTMTITVNIAARDDVRAN